MVAPVDTRPGRHITRSFTVNVRTPEGQQNDFGVPGTPGLTLTFAGADPAVADLRVVPAARSTHRLFLIGDSTVTDQENSPYTGLGQRLPAEIRRGVSVVNHSGSGESTVSYLADPRLWATLRPQIRRGDVALVQLAHNDKTTTADTYRANLQTMIDGIRQRGGRPVLVTPIVRHRFTDGKINSTGLIVNNLGVDLPAEIRAVAAQQHVPLIDLTAKSESLLESLGPDEAEPIYLIREIGDRTHTSEYGATVYAGMVADELRRYDLTVQ